MGEFSQQACATKANNSSGEYCSTQYWLYLFTLKEDWTDVQFSGSLKEHSNLVSLLHNIWKR